MNHFLWQFQNLNVPMMEDANGTLYTTSPILASLLQVTEDNLRMVYQNHQDEFDGLSVSDIYANDFLRQNKEVFGIQRVRADLHVWSEDDLILFAAFANSSQGKEFRKAMKELVKQQARKTLITKEYFDAVVSQLVAKNIELQARVDAVEAAQPHLRNIASNAGKLLNDQKHTKPFRS